MQKLLMQMQKLLTFFQQKYATFNDQSFNDRSTNDIVTFEQLGPDHHFDHLFVLKRFIIS